MSTFLKNNLKLTGQGITGEREWVYTDTGAITDVVAAGYFTVGHDMGMRVGDWVRIRDSVTPGLYSGLVSVAQDTGATQVTVDTGLAAL